MTGKEALNELMETFYELCEECNCNEDMYQKHNLTSPHHIIRKELDELAKYKSAFDILKRIVNYGYIDPEFGIFDSNIDLSEEEEKYVISLIDKENKWWI